MYSAQVTHAQDTPNLRARGLHVSLDQNSDDSIVQDLFKAGDEIMQRNKGVLVTKEDQGEECIIGEKRTNAIRRKKTTTHTYTITNDPLPVQRWEMSQ